MMSPQKGREGGSPKGDLGWQREERSDVTSISGSLDSPYKESRWIKIKSKSFIVLPDDLAWIDLNNKIALKQPLIKTEQNKLTYKLSSNTINILI